MKSKIKIYLLIQILSFNFLTVTAQNFKLPQYEKFIMPNGLTIYLMEQHEVPLISVTTLVKAGAIFDGSKSGLASVTASALMYGTKSFTKSQIEETLDFIGTGISSNASKEFATIITKFAAKDKTKVLAILKEILINPVFDIKEFEKEKKRLLINYEQAKESPRRVINSYFDKLIYDKHVYGNISQGIASSVKKLTVLDCKNFYKAMYAPNNSTIAVVGDFNIVDMKKTLNTLLGSWIKGTNTIANTSNYPTPTFTENKVFLVNKEDAKETTFLIGGQGIKRSNPDQVAVEVVNTLFGGRFTSMLNDELRVNSGLTYGANSRFTSLKNNGGFAISTFTALKTTEAAIDMALSVLNKLHKEGLNDTALTSAKNYVKGQFPPRFETVDQLSSLLTQMYFYEFDESYINNFEKNVDELTLSKANEIIAKYFPKNNLQFVLISKVSEIKNIAAKYGKVINFNIKDDIILK